MVRFDKTISPITVSLNFLFATLLIAENSTSHLIPLVSCAAMMHACIRGSNGLFVLPGYALLHKSRQPMYGRSAQNPRIQISHLRR